MTTNSTPRDGSTTGRSTTAAPGTASPAIPEDVAALGYEDAKDELVRVVGRLESGGEPLEASLALWERGEALAAQCQRRLDGARERVEQARQDQTTTTEDQS